MGTRKITLEEINDIYGFIRLALYDFYEMGLRPEDLKIAFPNWLKIILTNYPPRLDHFTAMELYAMTETQKFCNVETQPHYADEVVVFFKDYYNNQELYKPKIYVINFEK